MADQLHQHPDGTISVRVGDRIYIDTEKNFKKDFGVTLQKVPAGLDERLYEQGVRHALSAKNSVIDGGPMPWAAGDTVFGNLDDALAKQQQRIDDDVEKDKKRVRDEAEQHQRSAKDRADRRHAENEAKVAEDAERREVKHAKDFDDKEKAGKKKQEDDEVERVKNIPKNPNPPKPPKPE